jgi:hypothetical protein
LADRAPLSQTALSIDWLHAPQENVDWKRTLLLAKGQQSNEKVNDRFCDRDSVNETSNGRRSDGQKDSEETLERVKAQVARRHRRIRIWRSRQYKIGQHVYHGTSLVLYRLNRAYQETHGHT